MKTWKEIRTETINLGFEKIKAYEKNKQAYVDAYNWAQGIIASTVGGVIDKAELNYTQGDIVDIEELAKEKGEEFVAVAQTGILDADKRKVNGWTLTDNRFFSLDDFTGQLTITMLVMPKKITTGSEDTTECQLPDRWRNIL